MSLSLKIFLWFWGAITGVLLVLIVIFGTVPEENSVKSGSIANTLVNYSVASVGAFANGGDAGLRTFLNSKRQNGVQMYLFDPQNRARGLKAGERVPSEVQDIASDTHFGTQSSNGGTPKYQISKFRLTVAQPVGTPDGVFVFVVSASRSLLVLRHLNSRTTLLSVVMGFLIVGLFSSVLARYLATPVSRIRLAAQRISAGDLSARVQPNHIPRGRDEIAHLARDFDTMAGRLQSLVTAQNRLLGDVSHELRSPLARMNLALELARRGDETKRLAALERIERESARLDVLVGELLTLSRLENGLSAETLNHAVDLVEVCREVAADAEFEASNAGRGVSVSFSGPDKPVIVRGDPELLHRAVENVTRNALRHTANDSPVDIELSMRGPDVEISIADCGPGVPPDELDAIFYPFYRVEGARDRPDGSSGTGLGLAIAQRAVAAHGGTISARNRPEGGLEVRLSLPKERAGVLPKAKD